MRSIGKSIPMTAISLALAVAPGKTSAAEGPCDLYQAGATPCVAAHSTVRALYGSYTGNLYQVKRGSDSATKDIGVLAAGGFVNAATQDQFCANTTCTITILYDQSGKGNHLTAAPGGGAVKTPDKRVVATDSKLSISGHTAYAAKFTGAMGYRNNKTSGIATGDQPESMYMVTSGTYVNAKCCFDYGNAETNNFDDGNGTMEAINFGTLSYWGKGAGSGPWVMADLENGLFAGQSFTRQASNPSLTYDYVTAMVKGNSGNSFAIKGGNAQSGKLGTYYSGPRPTAKGYNPMLKQGAIILGIGGDNSNASQGIFYEGCMTSGFSSNATDSAVQANIVAAKYGSTATMISNRGDEQFLASLRYDPSAAVAEVRFTLDRARTVRLHVVDLQGREVANLLEGMLPTGQHVAVWNSVTAHPGLYALTMEIEGRRAWSERIIVGR